MDLQKLAFDCEGCPNFNECKTKLKACQLYHNKLEGLPWKEATVEPTYQWFDSCEDSYDEMQTRYVTTPINNVWHDASTLYESSTLDMLDENYRPHVESWKWLWAVRGNKVIGGAGYEHRSGSCILNFLYIRKHYQGQGIGTSLIDRIADQDDKMIVWADNNSETFYASLGFIPELHAYVRN